MKKEYTIKIAESRDEMRLKSEPLPKEVTDIEGTMWLWLEKLTEGTACLGLVGAQIGLPYRAFYIHAEQDKPALRFRNPEIVEVSDAKYVFRNEGCMSFPDQRLDTERRQWIKVRDEINGEKIYTGLEGACVQHEMDHLDGVLIFDRKAHSTYIRGGVKLGRNDPCCCGSGKKAKKCCYGG